MTEFERVDYDVVPNEVIHIPFLRNTLVNNGADWSDAPNPNVNYLPNYFNKWAKINKWSRYKPVATDLDKMTKEQVSNDTGWRLISSNPNIIEYKLPDISLNHTLRLSDYRGYNPSAKPLQIRFGKEHGNEWDIYLGQYDTSATFPIAIQYPEMPMHLLNPRIGGDGKLRISVGVYGTGSYKGDVYVQSIDFSNGEDLAGTTRIINATISDGLPVQGAKITVGLSVTYGTAHFDEVGGIGVGVVIYRQFVQNPDNDSHWSRSITVEMDNLTEQNIEWSMARFLLGHEEGNRSGFWFQELELKAPYRLEMRVEKSGQSILVATIDNTGGIPTPYDVVFYRATPIVNHVVENKRELKFVLDEDLGYGRNQIKLQYIGLN